MDVLVCNNVYIIILLITKILRNSQNIMINYKKYTEKVLFSND